MNARLKIELPSAERGRAPSDVRRLDRLRERLARTPFDKEDQRVELQRQIARLECLPQEVAEKAWREQSAAETLRLATERGEDVTTLQSGGVRVTSRDPLMSLLRAGKLTVEQYDAGVVCRDCYEARSQGVGSQMADPGAVGGAHNNDRFVFMGLQRAKKLHRIIVIERAILLSPTFAAAGGQSHVGLQILRAVCSEGKSLSSQGEGRAFDRNLKAIKVALDVASRIIAGR